MLRFPRNFAASRSLSVFAGICLLADFSPARAQPFGRVVPLAPAEAVGLTASEVHCSAAPEVFGSLVSERSCSMASEVHGSITSEVSGSTAPAVSGSTASEVSGLTPSTVSGSVASEKSDSTERVLSDFYMKEAAGMSYREWRMMKRRRTFYREQRQREDTFEYFCRPPEHWHDLRLTFGFIPVFGNWGGLGRSGSFGSGQQGNA